MELLTKTTWNRPFSCSSIVSDDGHNYFDDDVMIGWPYVGAEVAISPIRACSTLPHSRHGYVGPV